MFKKIIKSSILPIIIYFLIGEFLEISFFKKIILTITFLFILKLLLNFRLYSNGLIEFVEDIKSNKVYFALIKKYQEDFGLTDYRKISPPIQIRDSQFRVVEFFEKSVLPSAKPLGYLVLSMNKSNSQIKKKDALLARNLYNFWYDLYFNPLFGKSSAGDRMTLKEIYFAKGDCQVSPSNQYLFKSVVLLEGWLFKGANKRKKQEYKKIKPKFNKESLELIREYDNLLITQHNKTIKILKRLDYWSSNCLKLFRKVSFKEYIHLLNDAKEIHESLVKENDLINRRVGLFKKINKQNKMFLNNSDLLTYFASLLFKILLREKINLSEVSTFITLILIKFLKIVQFLVNKNILFSLKMDEIKIKFLRELNKGARESYNRYRFKLENTQTSNIYNYSEFH